MQERTGGLRLSNGSASHDADASEGIGDRRGGEIRTPADQKARVGRRAALDQIEGMREIASDEVLEQFEEQVVRSHYKGMDDPNIEYVPQGDGRFLVKANPKVDIVSLRGVEMSPYALCLSREPDTKAEWDALRASLPGKYDSWTITEYIKSLTFEIECGIKRWLALNEVSQHSLRTLQGWISYEYDEAPASRWANVGQLVMSDRWFRKRTRYQAQNEYRVL